MAVDRDSPHTLVFYESPHRLKAFLEDALIVYGDRQAAVANDLTKMFESVERGRLSDLLQIHAAKEGRGEYTVGIGGAGDEIAVEPDDEV